MRNIILFLIIILILNFFNFSLELPGDYLNELNKQHSSKHFKNFFYREYNTEGEQNLTPRFQEGNEYIYNYDAQVENGMLSSIDSTENKEESKQQAITRIKSEIKMFFPSEEQGQLCMTKIKFGQMNDLKHSEGKEECCDPMEMFEPKQIPQEVRQILEHCFTFNYVNGMIVRIHFHKDDVNWSQNIKRGVLNMLQLNLRQNNVQRESEEMRGGENVMGNNKNVDQLAYGYTIPEMTVEGECQTSYTINRASRSQQCQENQQQRTPCSFNVTKSINFKKCSKIVNLTNGYQTVEQQTKRSQCPLNDNTKSRRSEEQEGTEENVYAERDLRELNHQTVSKLDRQTVMRVMVKCGTEQKHQQNNNCQLENSEIVSNYVYKNTKIESEGPYGSSLRTKTCAKLSLVTVQSNQQQQMTLSQTSDREETLLFSNEWGYILDDFICLEMNNSRITTIPHIKDLKLNQQLLPFKILSKP
ncbi:Vitellogenin domain-containing protein [Meloidogyne graminicola]|uniref:Vitellogenin domain-containing protein n=1 Tax=Meloidogyne graminicola TaxID=189291 RepID=A0A8S9ZHB9_9BILA|nr:Vitellogenin domain-containing protein [Meloidogyne graminicola]